MFFKKKTLVLSDPAPNLGPLYTELATELYYGIGAADTMVLTATLEFDNEQRIASVKNPTVNGYTELPKPETIEKLNIIAAPLRSLPRMYQLKSLEVSLRDGRISTNAIYAE